MPVDPPSTRANAAKAPLTVDVNDGRGRPVRDGGLGRWLARAAPKTVRGSVCVALVTDPVVRRLNRSYRRIDAVTDVLSFPAERVMGPGSDNALGDIVIAKGVAKRQAKAHGHSYQTELRVLALHGLLHLIGYDHESPKDAGRMRRVEARLRQRHGLPSGLIEREAGE